MCVLLLLCESEIKSGTPENLRATRGARINHTACNWSMKVTCHSVVKVHVASCTCICSVVYTSPAPALSCNQCQQLLFSCLNPGHLWPTCALTLHFMQQPKDLFFFCIFTFMISQGIPGCHGGSCYYPAPEGWAHAHSCCFHSSTHQEFMSQSDPLHQPPRGQDNNPSSLPLHRLPP